MWHVGYRQICAVPVSCAGSLVISDRVCVQTKQASESTVDSIDVPYRIQVNMCCSRIMRCRYHALPLFSSLTEFVSTLNRCWYQTRAQYISGLRRYSTLLLFILNISHTTCLAYPRYADGVDTRLFSKTVLALPQNIT